MSGFDSLSPHIILIIEPSSTVGQLNSMVPPMQPILSLLYVILVEKSLSADATMFNGKDALPTNGLFKKIDSGDDSFFEEFSPAIRDSS